jgi:hypothetical protein
VIACGCEWAQQIGSPAPWRRFQPSWPAAALAGSGVMVASGTIELASALASLAPVVLLAVELSGMWPGPVHCGQELHLPVAFAAWAVSVAAALSAPLAAAPAVRAQATRAW